MKFGSRILNHSNLDIIVNKCNVSGTSLHIHVPLGKRVGLLIKLLSIQDVSTKFSCFVARNWGKMWEFPLVFENWLPTSTSYHMFSRIVLLKICESDTIFCIQYTPCYIMLPCGNRVILGPSGQGCHK